MILKHTPWIKHLLFIVQSLELEIFERILETDTDTWNFERILETLNGYLKLRTDNVTYVTLELETLYGYLKWIRILETLNGYSSDTWNFEGIRLHMSLWSLKLRTDTRNGYRYLKLWTDSRTNIWNFERLHIRNVLVLTLVRLYQSFFFKYLLFLFSLLLHFLFLPLLLATGSPPTGSPPTGSPLSDMVLASLSFFFSSWIDWCTANCSRWKINPYFSQEFYLNHLRYSPYFWTITETELSLDSAADNCLDFYPLEVTGGVSDVLLAGTRRREPPTCNISTEVLVDPFSDGLLKNNPCPWSRWRFDVIIGFRPFSILKRITKLTIQNHQKGARHRLNFGWNGHKFPKLDIDNFGQRLKKP